MTKDGISLVPEVEGAVAPHPGVVFGIRPERSIEIPPTEDERPVEALGPDRRDDPFGVRVGVRTLYGVFA